ncbi:Zinc finger CCHC-type protein [Macrophomina phaseolina MS6]|uniref:Zinc finger CCHC-type protein n=1 Tax=Macrophomina phaseolina (strain MS6) TaxID=1126212 RepID=K2RBP7_MACPH|nr:Zinc finger CCHC-type protein [Macrophomina phaseolina MS6]
MKLDGDDNDYSPSLDPPDKSSRERPESPSQLDLEFPHMSTASETAAKVDQLSTAQEKVETGKNSELAQPAAAMPEAEDFIALPVDDAFGAEDDDTSSDGSDGEIEGEEGEKKDAGESGTEAGPISLTKSQVKLIRDFEGERALRILKNGIGAYWTSKKGFNGNNAAGAIVTVPIPQIPEKKNPAKTSNAIHKETIRNRLATLIGTNCPIGLVGLYHDSHPDSKDFNQLVVYRKQEQIDALKSYLAASPVEFTMKGGKKDSLLFNVVTPDGSKGFQLQDNKKLKTSRGVTSSLCEGMTSYVTKLLETGRMAPDAYEGFNPDKPKKMLQKAIKQDIGAGVLTADPKYAWEHLQNGVKPVSPPAKSEPQPQSASKDTSTPSTKPSTPTSESRVQGNSSGDEGEISEEEAEYTPPSPPPQNDNPIQISKDPTRTRMSQLSEEERQLQARYFGSARDSDPVHCVTCAQPGHMQESCPSRTCQHCKAVDQHFSQACPMVAKCTKCRERGHAKENCPSKLARTAADGFFCDLCNQAGHVEEDCSRLWRTFDPDKIPNLNKVARLTVSCYQCGSHLHWGDDCPMRPRRAAVNCDTFSAKEANKYLIDPDAAAAELRQNGYSGQGLSIKGRAQNQHTYFTSSDSEGDIDNFYRNKRNSNNGPSRGNIRINAGAGARGGRFSQQNDRNGGNNGGGGGYNEPRNSSNQFQPVNRGWQPPLPNEPPPPLPPQPPRGGYGGRGRGRGRGGGGGGSGVNQMPLPARPGPAPKKPRRGGKR